MSDQRLQLSLLAFYEKGLLSDITIVAEGREIKAHKAILGSQSEWFLNEFHAAPARTSMEVNQKYKVMKALVRFMYFGSVAASTDLGPGEGLDLLLCAEDFGITALDGEDCEPLILPRLTMQNSIDVLLHEGLNRHPALAHAVCDFVGSHFMKMLPTMEEDLHNIPMDLLATVLKTACMTITTDNETERLVRFCLGHTQLETACDLLRETKAWGWGGEEATEMRSLPKDVPSSGPEWRIDKVRSAMEETPARIVSGTFFDWTIRLDYGSEGKLRIVYESATPKVGEDGAIPVRCINRFPAAMFAWRVLYRGQDVFNEKPVFICFPENVQLHWSTTLPVSAGELSDDDDLTIIVNMAENPMLSLILYYFSSDLKATVMSEDILNRLPHIEYRCLSSYSIVRDHM